MKIDCKKYIGGRCLSIYSSLEEVRTRAGLDLGDLSPCLYSQEGVYAGRDASECIFRRIDVSRRQVAESALATA